MRGISLRSVFLTRASQSILRHCKPEQCPLRTSLHRQSYYAVLTDHNGPQGPRPSAVLRAHAGAAAATGAFARFERGSKVQPHK